MGEEDRKGYTTAYWSEKINQSNSFVSFLNKRCFHLIRRKELEIWLWRNSIKLRPCFWPDFLFTLRRKPTSTTSSSTLKRKWCKPEKSYFHISHFHRHVPHCSSSRGCYSRKFHGIKTLRRKTEVFGGKAFVKLKQLVTFSV